MTTEADSTTRVRTKNTNLQAAKAAKNDEFYTQWADIEREMNAYLEYDPDVFRGKVILLPCDDPEWSNFTKFFALHFMDYGLKKLISTSYAPDSNPASQLPANTVRDRRPAVRRDQDPCERQEVRPGTEGRQRRRRRQHRRPPVGVPGGRRRLPQRRGHRAARRGRHRHHQPAVQPVPIHRVACRRRKKFSIIGNNNAITYVEIFPLIKENRLWKGATVNSTDMVFGVPEGHPGDGGRPLKAEGWATRRTKFATSRGWAIRWFTNIEHGRRHEPLQLMTMADNIKFTKHKEVRGVGYQRTTTTTPSRSRSSTRSRATTTA